MTRKNLLYLALGGVALFLLPSCADYGYYGYGGGYGPASYGSSLAVLPYGYTRVYVGSTPYWYHGNRWYRYSGGRYIHCARPHGYRGHSHYHHRHYTRPYSSYSRPYHGLSHYHRSSSPFSYRHSAHSHWNRSPYSYRRTSHHPRHSSHVHRHKGRAESGHAWHGRRHSARPDRGHSAPRATAPRRGGGSRGPGATSVVSNSGST